MVLSSVILYSQENALTYLKAYRSNLESEITMKEKVGVVTEKVFSLKSNQLKTLEKTITPKSDFYELLSEKASSLVVLKDPIRDKKFNGVLARMYSYEGLQKVKSDSVIFEYNDANKQYEKRLKTDSITIELKTEFLYLQGDLTQNWLRDQFNQLEIKHLSENTYYIPQGYLKKSPLYVIQNKNTIIVTNNSDYLNSNYPRIEKKTRNSAEQSRLFYGKGKVDALTTSIEKGFFETRISEFSNKEVKNISYDIKKKQLRELTY